MNLPPLLRALSAFLLAPLLLGVVARVKAVFAGRTGRPFLQVYFDIVKLLRKGAVYSRTTSWLFRAGPILGLACAVTALLVAPWGRFPARISFPGDFIALAGLLALMRFVTVLAALDTGSSFEGMGASREVTFSALAEPALLLSPAVLCRLTGSVSLSGMFGRLAAGGPAGSGPAVALVFSALFVVFLAENARIPFDDPETHLELTMIHEVMVLDHGGPDLAFILAASAIKFWVLGSLLAGIVLPAATGAWAVPAAVFGLAVLVGTVESVMARLRLVRVPHLLIGAGALACVALILTME